MIVTNIYITDPSNKSHARLRRDYVSFKTLESDLDQSFTFFHSSVSIYHLVEDSATRILPSQRTLRR